MTERFVRADTTALTMQGFSPFACENAVAPVTIDIQLPLTGGRKEVLWDDITPVKGQGRQNTEERVMMIVSRDKGVVGCAIERLQCVGV